MDLGQGLVPAGAPAWADELAGSLDHLGMQVTRENVVQVARVLLDEAARVKADGKWHGRHAVVRPCGDDPVSHDAAREFTPRLQDLVAQGLLVADMLHAAGERLLAAARGYGHAEAEIAAVLRPVGPRP